MMGIGICQKERICGRVIYVLLEEEVLAICVGFSELLEALVLGKYVVGAKDSSSE